MKRALFGHTGFVAQNLLLSEKFDFQYNSKNVKESAGQEFDEIVFSAAKSEKWRANKDPQADYQHISELKDILSRIKAKRVTLISTVDVYPTPFMVNESSLIDVSTHSAYGKHRRELEVFVKNRFPNHLIARLPALFGEGLKKNALFDILNDNEVVKLDSRWIFQYYNLAWLAKDLKLAEQNQIRELNLVSEPVTLAEVYRAALGNEFTQKVDKPVSHYDVWSKHSKPWSRVGNYLYGKDQVLIEIANFAKSYKRVK